MGPGRSSNIVWRTARERLDGSIKNKATPILNTPFLGIEEHPYALVAMTSHPLYHRHDRLQDVQRNIYTGNRLLKSTGQCLFPDVQGLESLLGGSYTRSSSLPFQHDSIRTSCLLGQSVHSCRRDDVSLVDVSHHSQDESQARDGRQLLISGILVKNQRRTLTSARPVIA